MQSKLLSLVVTTVLAIFFSACGGEDLVNAPKEVPVATLSADVSSVILAVGSSESFEVNATKANSTEDNVSAVSSNTDIFDVNVTDNIVTVYSNSIGSGNITITSGSGIMLEIPVIVTDKPTLSLDISTLNMDISSEKEIIATATTDGTTEDIISVSSSNTDILAVRVTNNVITAIGVSPGSANILVVSGSDMNATCIVTVNIDEDPNDYANHSSSAAFALTIEKNINDTVADKYDWYVFDTVVGNEYEIRLNKFIDNGGIEAKFYTDPSSTEEFSVLVDNLNAQETVSKTFTAASTKYYAKISNMHNTNPALDSDATDYLLNIIAIPKEPDPIINPSTLTVGQDYIQGIVNDDSGVSYSFAGEYGKLYEVWIYDKVAQSTPVYTLDITTTAYTQDKNQIYFAESNMYHVKPELINPIKSEDIHIHVKPLYSGKTGTYAIKIVEKTSYSEGQKTVKVPLKDGLVYTSKIGKELSVSQWSYYSTDAIASVTKTISLSSISPKEDLYIKLFEDSECKDEVASINSGSTGKAEISYKYSKNGIFCVGVFNKNAKNLAVYDIKIAGNKPIGSNTYPSLVKQTIPDGNGSVLLSQIEVKYGVLAISKISVDLNITHTYDIDLTMTLVSPTGTEVILSENRGVGEDNYINTNFDDNASISISAGSAPFTGAFKPESPLSAFIGESPNGIWMLKVEDENNGDSGTLDSWSITIE